MIRCHLARVMGDKRLKIVDVARDTGINRGTITRMYHDQAERIELEVLDALCSYLGVGIDELYEFRNENEVNTPI